MAMKFIQEWLTMRQWVFSVRCEAEVTTFQSDNTRILVAYRDNKVHLRIPDIAEAGIDASLSLDIMTLDWEHKLEEWLDFNLIAMPYIVAIRDEQKR